eukprot:303518_1
MVMEQANAKMVDCVLEGGNLDQIESQNPGAYPSKDQEKTEVYSLPSTPSTPLMDKPGAPVMTMDDAQHPIRKSFEFTSNKEDIYTTDEGSESNEVSIVLPFSPEMLTDVPSPYEPNMSPKDCSQLVEDSEVEQTREEYENCYQGEVESDTFLSSINDDSSSALIIDTDQVSQDDLDLSEEFGEISAITSLAEEGVHESLEDLDVNETPQVPSTPTYLAERRSSVICSRELGYDELPPTFNLAKLRSKMFGVKKGKPVPLAAKPLKKLKNHGSVKDLGSMKLETVELYRPEFNDLVPVQTINAHDGFVWVVSFSTNGKFLATGGEDGRVCVWKVGDMVAYTKINIEKKAAPGVFGTDDVEDWEHGVIRKRLSVQAYSKVHKNGRILVPEPVFKSPEEGGSRHCADVTALSWTKDSLLLSGSLDGTVRLWKPEGEKGSESEEGGGGKCISRYACQSGITTVVSDPIYPQRFVCGALNETLHVWNTRTGELLCSKKLPVIPTAIIFSRDGATVLVGLSNGTVQIRNSRTMALCSIAKVSPGHKISGLAMYRNGREFLASSADSTLRSLLADDFKNSKPVLSSAKSISKVRKMIGHSTKRLPIIPSISEDERFVISGSEDGHIYIWDASETLDGGKSSKTFTGFQRWPVSEEGTVVTHAQFFPQASVDRCVSQIEYYQCIRQLVDGEGTAKGFLGLPSPAANPACQNSMPRGSSDEESPCRSGQQQAMAYGHTHQDASHILAESINNGDRNAAMAVGQRRGCDEPGSYQIDGDQRSSAALLQGWRKMQRGSDARDANNIQNDNMPNATPQNSIIVAAEASGRLVVYVKSSVVSEFKNRLNAHGR